MLELPKTRLDVWPFLVGSPVFGQSVVKEWDQSTLAASSSNYRLKGGAWSGGGPFYVRSQGTSHAEGVDLPLGVPGFNFGPFSIRAVIGATTGPPPQVLPVPSYSDISDPLIAFGAKGWAKTRPGNPIAGSLQALVEVGREGLPKVPGSELFKNSGRAFQKGSLRLNPGQVFATLPQALRSQVEVFRRLGGEYLNVVFGWKPLVSDIRKMFLLWQKIDREMGNIIRENGKVNRRHATLLETTDVQSDPPVYSGSPYLNVFGAPPDFFSGNKGSTYQVVRKTYDHVWYMAAFRYFIPDVGSSQWTARAKAVLFGALPTPDTLWSVMPWAWLVDWFSDIGDVISNVSPNAVDNLVALHAYTMRTLRVTATYTCDSHHESSPPFGLQYPEVRKTFTSVDYVTDKIRYPGANPFAFGSTGDSVITPGRMAILAALGLSKGVPPLR